MSAPRLADFALHGAPSGQEYRSLFLGSDLRFCGPVGTSEHVWWAEPRWLQGWLQADLRVWRSFLGYRQRSRVRDAVFEGWGQQVPIRYMGTKRHIAHHVRDIVHEMQPTGRVLDLFSGMGAVAQALADVRSVVTNDALSFTNAFARSRFVDGARAHTVGEVLDVLRAPYRAQVANLAADHRSTLRDEQRALDGGPGQLADYMAHAQFVANSDRVRLLAQRAQTLGNDRCYQLATLYFSAGYFGLRQSIHLDALRCAIDSVEPEVGISRDWLMAAWIGAASTVINAPGHTAQFLKPNDEPSFNRIRRYWRRSLWDEFQNRLLELKPIGTATWRRRNRVINADALELIAGLSLRGIGAVYADPPYTKDQYSRYYHVYETLYRYDFPDSHGVGRVRSDRFSTAFCLKTGVQNAFAQLFEAVAERKVPLILSYPSAGLLGNAGSTVPDMLRGRLDLRETRTFNAQHSTLGASSGSNTKDATENLYVCSA